MHECKTCPYFTKKAHSVHRGVVVVGLCGLRKKYVTAERINKDQCKDRAIIPLAGSDRPPESKERFVKDVTVY